MKPRPTSNQASSASFKISRSYPLNPAPCIHSMCFLDSVAPDSCCSCVGRCPPDSTTWHIAFPLLHWHVRGRQYFGDSGIWGAHPSGEPHARMQISTTSGHLSPKPNHSARVMITRHDGVAIAIVHNKNSARNNYIFRHLDQLADAFDVPLTCPLIAVPVEWK